MKELNKSSNAVYRLNYRLVIVVKYRRKVFTNDAIVERLKDFVAGVCPEYGVEVINQECGDDHLHILFSAKPSTDICKFINIVKGHSSRMIRKEFRDHISDKLWGDSFWSPSYYLSTVGNTSINTIYKYIESQRTEK